MGISRSQSEHEATSPSAHFQEEIKSPRRSRSCSTRGMRRCRAGVKTNNPFLNYLRVFRKKHCGWPQRKVAIEGAKCWCRLKPKEKKKFYEEACSMRSKLKNRRRRNRRSRSRRSCRPMSGRRRSRSRSRRHRNRKMRSRSRRGDGSRSRSRGRSYREGRRSEKLRSHRKGRRGRRSSGSVRRRRGHGTAKC